MLRFVYYINNTLEKIRQQRGEKKKEKDNRVGSSRRKGFKYFFASVLLASPIRIMRK